MNLHSRLVDYFVPTGPVKHGWEYRKYRLFISVSLVSAIYALLFFPTSMLEEYYDAVKVIVVFFFLNISFPFLVKRGVSLRLVTNLYILTLAGSLSVIMYVSGGIHHTATDPQLMVLLPIMALLFINFRWAIGWFLVAVTILVVFGVLELNGYEFEIRMNEKYIQLQGLLAVIGHLLLVFMVINIFERQKNMALNNLNVRNEQLDNEKQRSEELLSNILPHDVIEELQEKGHSEAKLFNDVTVFFSDFVNFTHISESLSPQALVGELNYYFKAFDDIISKYGLEKIKTIGDAYMATGGLYSDDESTHLAVINAALEMQEVVSERREERASLGLPYFEMRVGIHTGPVVAGIVGVKKFQYDIWGDTVNTASRMENAGEPRKVNISESTYRLVSDSPDLKFQSRGVYDVKGKGDMKMYFVERKSRGVGAEA